MRRHVHGDPRRAGGGDVPHRDPKLAADRYSPPECIGAKKESINGRADPARISTSCVERANLTIRMDDRHFTRLTNAFSKKIDNHIHMLSIFFVHYNFCRIDKTLRVTPAVEAGIADTVLDMEWIVGLLDANAPKPVRPVTNKKAVQISN